MYSHRSGLLLGFHGCEQSVRDTILTNGKFKPSTNKYDWLGHGMYFWEHNEARALEFAAKPSIANPSVIGAIIDLGHCLNLLDKTYLDLLKDSYDILSESFKKRGTPLPQNKRSHSETDFLLRYLDCAVIEHLHQINEQAGLTAFDSVKGVFTEGEPVYEGCGINNKNHIQVCIRNPNCIKGFFLPRSYYKNYSRV